MGKNIVSLLLLITLFMCSCSEEFVLNEPIQNELEVLSRSYENNENSYTVTPEMVCKYINLANKEKVVNIFDPIIRKGDTLAYYIQYDKGWDLISGDRRLPPVLAMSNTGTLDFTNNDKSNVKGIEGILIMVEEKKISNDTIKDAIWKLLEPPVLIRNTIQNRNGVYGEGMWIAIDTVYNLNTSYKDHILTTKWGQDLCWQQYTPYENGEHTLTGCVAVATGQHIYHFRKNNNREITLPQTITFSDTINGSPIFSNFSTNAWYGLANTNLDTGTDKVATFLSYLGFQLGLDYGTGLTSGMDTWIIDILNQYKIQADTSDIYSYNRVIENLDRNIPIIVCATYHNYNPNVNAHGSGHAFNIDGYRKNSYESYILFKWEPDYKITIEDIHYGEQWRFEPPEKTDKDGTAYKKYYTADNYIHGYLCMNWGYSGASNNIYYLAYNYMVSPQDQIEIESESINWIAYDNNGKEYISNYIYHIIYDSHESEY